MLLMEFVAMEKNGVIDEMTIEYDPCLAWKKVSGDEVYEKNLKPSFKSRRINVGVFVCIAKGRQMDLILV